MLELQQSLLCAGPEGPDATATTERRPLSEGAWVDVARGWWRGADELLVDLVAVAPWKQRRRRMYERLVDDPRLSCRSDDPAVSRRVEPMRVALADRYGVDLSTPFLNYYRDGRDSVAFHADRELRQLDQTLVAIVTLGAARPFLLRPKGGGPSLDLRPGSGDLLVMGGRCQLDWQHGVPKVAGCGPRISVSMRWAVRARG